MSPEIPDPLPVRSVLERMSAYQPGRSAEEVAREHGIEDVVKLASNEGPHPPFPPALRAIEAAAASANVYPEPTAAALREELAGRLGIGADAILVGSGIDGLISTIATTFLEPGAELAMCWPSFVSWPLRAQLAGAALVRAPLAADGAFDLDALATLVGPRTRLVVVVSPNNPTGGAVSAGALAAFAESLPPSATLVVDEAYFEFLPAGGHDGLDILRGGGRAIVLRTFSKAYGLAALRVGYLVAQPDLVRELAKVRPAFDVSSIAQAAALASLSSADEHLESRLAEIARERALLASGLSALGLEPLPSAANFVTVGLGSAERAEAVHQALMRRGVVVRPAGAFGAPDHLRITVGRSHEGARLLAALGETLVEAPARQV